jgi:hypothetical protein
MRHVYTRPLRDEELRSHLQRGDAILFSEAVKDWLEIERQVERLGFGEQYTVSRASKTEPTGERHHTRVSPLHPSAYI